jgi:predicted enzyme related to lactoylglutathione lyase
MPSSPFVWYDLMTSDIAAAERYYTNVVGWGVIDTGMDYKIWTMGERQVGGLMLVPEDAKAMGARPCWMGYVGVADVDAKAAELTQAGGKVLKPGTDIPNVGRFAVVADPQGAGFLLFTGATDERPIPTPEGTPGQIGWRELMTTDSVAGFDFYAKLFGWTKGEAMDMGPMGVYQLFNCDGLTIGGMMKRPPDADFPPSWQFYLNVEDIDSASSGSRPAAARSSTARCRCRPAFGSSRVSIRKAPSSPCRGRDPDRPDSAGGGQGFNRKRLMKLLIQGGFMRRFRLLYPRACLIESSSRWPLWPPSP